MKDLEGDKLHVLVLFFLYILQVKPNNKHKNFAKLSFVFVGPIGCRLYSGFSVSFSFNFVFLLLLLSTLSGILVCHIAEEVRGLKCGDSKSC